MLDISQITAPAGAANTTAVEQKGVARNLDGCSHRLDQAMAYDYADVRLLTPVSVYDRYTLKRVCRWRWQRAKLRGHIPGDRQKGQAHADRHSNQ